MGKYQEVKIMVWVGDSTDEKESAASIVQEAAKCAAHLIKQGLEPFALYPDGHGPCGACVERESCPLKYE